MVQIMGKSEALKALSRKLTRTVFLFVAGAFFLSVFYTGCTTRVRANEYGVEQRKFGFKTGIVEKSYGPGLYFVGIGATMHTFPREMHVLEASNDHQATRAKARSGDVASKVDEYFEKRDKVLGAATHRVVEALNVQTSDGYAVTCDVTLLYSLADPVKIAKEFGWGAAYVESFALNTFRNGVLATLGKMNAEEFYDEAIRIKAVAEAEAVMKQRFSDRGFKVEKLMLRNYQYVANYEKSLHDKKVAVQLAEKNRKESVVNEEKAKLKQIESKGNAAITIAESEVTAQISKINAEAELYSSQTRAKGDKEFNVAVAEAKRLKTDALTQAGGKYVVALETAKMFDNIEGAVMTPEQYISFIRNAWAIIGVNPTSTGGKDK